MLKVPRFLFHLKLLEIHSKVTGTTRDIENVVRHFMRHDKVCVERKSRNFNSNFRGIPVFGQTLFEGFYLEQLSKVILHLLMFIIIQESPIVF